jgi:hypothetical protein
MKRSMSCVLWSVAVVTASLLAAGTLEAGHKHKARYGGWYADDSYGDWHDVGFHGPAPFGDCGCEVPPQPLMVPKVVTKTIMVPHTTFKTVTVPETILRPEIRQRTIIVPRCIPETHMVTRVHTIMVPEVRSRTETYEVPHTTVDVVERPITVMVPHTEMRQGVRHVCESVPVQTTKTVCRDAGYWHTKTYVDCHGCVQTCNVYCPRVVTEEVPCTVYRPQMVEVPFTYPVTVCRPETRSVTERIPRTVFETKTREVPYTVPVPRQVTRQVPVRTMRTVQEEKIINYTHMVPHTVERTVQVPVCTMVPKTISHTILVPEYPQEVPSKGGPIQAPIQAPQK